MAEPSHTDKGDIEALITAFIRDELVGDTKLEIDAEDHLLASGIIDSIGLVRLIAHLRERLGVTVPPQEMVPGNFRTVRVMTRYLDDLLQR